MSNNGEKKFRAHLGGFNKDDVNNYIRDIDLQHNSEIEELNSKLEEAEAKLEETKKNIESLEKENSDLTMQVALAMSKADDIEAERSVFEETIANLESDKAVLEAQTAVLEGEKKELEKAKAALEGEKQELQGTNTVLSDKIEALKAELADASTSSVTVPDPAVIAENAELKARLDLITAELDAVKSAPKAVPDNSLAEENALLKAELEKAKAQLKNAEASAAKQAPAAPAAPASSTIERVRARLNYLQGGPSTPDEIMEAARENAQRLIDSTERECQAKRAECDSAVAKIRQETEEQALYIRDKLAKTAGAFLSNISTDLDNSIESCLREINSCVTDMESEVKTLLTKMSSRSNEMNERFSYYKNYLSDGIDETLYHIEKNSDGESKNG